MPSFPVSVDDQEGHGPEHAARTAREQWGVAIGPVGRLVRLLEDHGVLVVFSPPQTAAVDAYSFDSRLRPVVVLNPIKRDYYRQRFDLAHELGHLIMHSDAEPGGIHDQLPVAMGSGPTALNFPVLYALMSGSWACVACWSRCGRSGV